MEILLQRGEAEQQIRFRPPGEPVCHLMGDWFSLAHRLLGYKFIANRTKTSRSQIRIDLGLCHHTHTHTHRVSFHLFPPPHPTIHSCSDHSDLNSQRESSLPLGATPGTAGEVDFEP